MKIGSLFDGSGGFPLAASMCGIVPTWASEVEPYPIAVTRSRFPSMKHLGDISKINGAEIEPVDVISFGAPCQDLSVAGLRKGLRHEGLGDEETTRSGLFMEAVRIIKEMRKATNGRYPTFAIYENVPGALSSSGGQDWRTVLEELIKIVEPTASMPPVPKGGWAYADLFMGDGWSLGYRILDSQYIRTAQRRRRVYLVLHLTGKCAGKVLFERESLRGHYPQSRTQGQGIAADAERGSLADDREGNCLTPWDYQSKRCFGVDGVFPALFAGERSGQNQQAVCVPIGANGVEQHHEPCTLEPGIAAREGGHIYEGVSGTLRANAGDNQMAVAHPVPYTLKIRSGCEGGGKGALVQTDKSATLATNNDQYLFQPIPIHDKETRYKVGGSTRENDGSGNGLGIGRPGDPFPTLTNGDRHAVAFAVEEPAVAYSMKSIARNGVPLAEQANPICASDYKDPDIVAVPASQQTYQNTVGALCARDYKGVGSQYVDEDKLIIHPRPRYIVRRLTPTECARLQGFPDKWGHPEWISEDTRGDVPEFWREVYMTDCTIKNKKPKPTIAEKRNGWEVAVIRWYNKLHTGSSEYKMWGNGVALPCCLYVMEGIVDAMAGIGPV